MLEELVGLISCPTASPWATDLLQIPWLQLLHQLTPTPSSATSQGCGVDLGLCLPASLMNFSLFSGLQSFLQVFTATLIRSPFWKEKLGQRGPCCPYTMPPASCTCWR